MSMFGKPWNIWLHRSDCNFKGIHAVLAKHKKEFDRHGSVSIYGSKRRNPNYLVHADPQSACVQHYSTNILEFFKDGKIVITNWDSPDTRALIDSLSPIYVHRGRWSLHGQWWTPSYPFSDRDTVVIDSDGYVRGLRESHTRIKAAAKPVRNAIRREYMKHAFPRIMLGEFNHWAERVAAITPCWHAYVPDADEIVPMFCRNESFGTINANSMHRVALSKNFGKRTRTYETRDKALTASYNALLSRYLSGRREDFETVYTPIDPVKVL